jgi:hypothetical protein
LAETVRIVEQRIANYAIRRQFGGVIMWQHIWILRD